MRPAQVAVGRRRGGFWGDVGAVFAGPLGLAALAVALGGMLLLARDNAEVQRQDAAVSAWGRPGIDQDALRDALAAKRAAKRPAPARKPAETPREKDLRAQVASALKDALASVK